MFCVCCVLIDLIESIKKSNQSLYAAHRYHGCSKYSLAFGRFTTLSSRRWYISPIMSKSACVAGAGSVEGLAPNPAWYVTVTALGRLATEPGYE